MDFRLGWLWCSDCPGPHYRRRCRIVLCGPRRHQAVDRAVSSCRRVCRRSGRTETRRKPEGTSQPPAAVVLLMSFMVALNLSGSALWFVLILGLLKVGLTD